MAMAGWLLRRAAELRRDFTWREAGGSLGDLGTFIPLLPSSLHPDPATLTP